MKEKYFIDGSPRGDQNIEGWNSEGYREAFIRSFRKLKAQYEKFEICKHHRTLCSQLNIILGKLEENRKDILYSDLFEISYFLRMIDSSDVRHTYLFKKFKKGENGENEFFESIKHKSTYMLGTDNLNNWLPDIESLANCKDFYSKSNDFVRQLNLALAGVSGNTSEQSGTESQAIDDR